MLDEELLAEVGSRLYARCQAILDVQAARQGRVHCPDCAAEAKDSWIERPLVPREERDSWLLRCPACGWQLTWGEYRASFKRGQLNAGGALPSFTAFVDSWPRLHTPAEKMAAIDLLLHQFHYSLQTDPGLPTRPVAANLIKGSLEDTVHLLDELAGKGTQTAWARDLARYRSEFLGRHSRSGTGDSPAE